MNSEVLEKSDLKIGERYFKVELPCHSYQWIEILGYDETTGEYNYANVAKRYTGKIELYDTHLKSNFDKYFGETRERNQRMFRDEEEAKMYHQMMNGSAYNTLMRNIYK